MHALSLDILAINKMYNIPTHLLDAFVHVTIRVYPLAKNAVKNDHFLYSN